MLHASTQKLIHKLCALTERGDIAWREGEGSVLLFDTEGYRVEVHGEAPSVRLLRSDGKELENASAFDLAGTPWPDGEGTFASHVSEMARQALRAARGADLAISKILSSLSAPPQRAPQPSPAPVTTEASIAPEPPPSPHTVPDPALQPPHAETAVAKLFAVDRGSVPATDGIESISVEPEPVEPPCPSLPEPQFKAPVFPAPPRPPSYALVRQGFGAVRSFAIAPWIRPEAQPLPKPAVFPPAPAPPAPKAEPPIEPKVTSTGLFISGISASTRQTVRGELPPESAAPPPAPSVKTPPTPEPKREPAPATGLDIYKPWV